MSPLAGGAGFARIADLAVAAAYETEVRVSRGRWRRPLRMRLRLTPWWDGPRPQALVELLPVARVAVSAAYFRAGHEYLDRLLTELSSGPRASRAGRRAA